MRATHRLLSRAAATACADGLQLHGLAPSAGSWRESRVAADKTHHVSAAERVPLYAARFVQVLPFHAPGLAPAQLLDGRWSHIRPSGEPLAGRFLRTFGVYGERAAVTLSPGVWRHIDVNGMPAYDRTWAWCGNFQAGRCVVRHDDGPGGSPRYRHILADGTLLSRESYVYAGDFREGFAVVRTGETCDHIDENGARMHRPGQQLLDLDVFHKGFARARDARGWFFIGMGSGADAMKPAGTRYAQLEPFYNGHAVAMRSDGARVLLADDTLAETLLAV